jgi:ribosomal-protein-alanine N-acetyltransferase
MPILFPLDAAACAGIGDNTAPILRTLSNLSEVGDLIGGVAAAQADLYARTGAAAPWIGYLAYLPETGEAVGACSFKAACSAGAVEISYFTFPHAEGCGYGKAMATALVAIAGRHTEAHTLIAHTLPEENASGAILRGLRFRNLGPVDDPEDGVIWRWERPVRSSELRS